MFQVTEIPGAQQFTISSEMALVDRIVAMAKEYLAVLGTTHLVEFNVVLRELLINAIEHGNQRDLGKTVSCTIAHLGGPRYQITVIDEGPGFDHRNASFLMPQSGAPRSRGLALVHAFTDQLEFKDSGHHVDAFMTIIAPTGFAIAKEGGVTTVTPSGDLTAASADQFRQQLITLVEAGDRRIRFNLAAVTDLDSVSLSVLIAFAGMLRKQGDYAIELVNCSPDLINLFRMTRVDQDFKITITA
jgi:anti-anti-sigma factor